MIILKAIMLIITILIIMANNYKSEADDKTSIVNIIFIMYVVIILFG